MTILKRGDMVELHIVIGRDARIVNTVLEKPIQFKWGKSINLSDDGYTEG